MRNGPAPSSFIDRTASTGSWSTKRVLAHANGFFSVEENATLDISVSCARLGSSDVAREVRHQPVRGRAHQGRVMAFRRLVEPRAMCFPMPLQPSTAQTRSPNVRPALSMPA